MLNNTKCPFISWDYLPWEFWVIIDCNKNLVWDIYEQFFYNVLVTGAYTNPN